MRVLVLSPHGDDGELAMGATMARLVQEGHQVFHRLMTVVPGEIGDARRAEFRAASRVLCVEPVCSDPMPEDYLDQASQCRMTGRIETAIREVEPDQLYVPLPWFNQDHNAAYEAIVAALRPVPNVFHPDMVYGYEMPGQEWAVRQIIGTRYVKVGVDHMNQKIGALDCYQSQGASRDGRLIGPDGVWATAKLRGLECGSPGLGDPNPWAERFVVLREVVK